MTEASAVVSGQFCAVEGFTILRDMGPANCSSLLANWRALLASRRPMAADAGIVRLKLECCWARRPLRRRSRSSRAFKALVMDSLLLIACVPNASIACEMSANACDMIASSSNVIILSAASTFAKSAPGEQMEAARATASPPSENPPTTHERQRLLISYRNARAYPSDRTPPLAMYSEYDVFCASNDDLSRSSAASPSLVEPVPRDTTIRPSR